MVYNITATLSQVITDTTTVLDMIVDIFKMVVDIVFTTPLIIFAAIGIALTLFKFAGGFVGLRRRF